MNKFFNRADQTAKRRKLRASAPRAEKMVWAQLRNNRCGAKFRRQVSIETWVVDFYSPELRLAIEIDGPTHDNDAASTFDLVRQHRIEAHGVRFVRITNEQVYDHLPEVMESIQAIVEQLKER